MWWPIGKQLKRPKVPSKLNVVLLISSNIQYTPDNSNLQGTDENGSS